MEGAYHLQYQEQAGSNYLGSGRFGNGALWVPRVAFTYSRAAAHAPALLQSLLFRVS